MTLKDKNHHDIAFKPSIFVNSHPGNKRRLTSLNTFTARGSKIICHVINKMTSQRNITKAIICIHVQGICVKKKNDNCTRYSALTVFNGTVIEKKSKWNEREERKRSNKWGVKKHDEKKNERKENEHETNGNGAKKKGRTRKEKRKTKQKICTGIKRNEKIKRREEKKEEEKKRGVEKRNKTSIQLKLMKVFKPACAPFLRFPVSRIQLCRQKGLWEARCPNTVCTRGSEPRSAPATGTNTKNEWQWWSLSSLVTNVSASFFKQSQVKICCGSVDGSWRDWSVSR